MDHSQIDILKCFPRCRVGVLGDLMLDQYFWGSATRISPEAPVPVVLVKRRNCVPGGAANVARNVLSLKARVSVFGCIGDDEEGRMLAGLLTEAGADIAGVVALSGGKTSVKTRVLADNQQVVRVDQEIPEQVTENARAGILAHLEKAFQAGELDALVMEDYAKGVFTAEFMKEAAAMAHRYGIRVTLDPHPSHVFDVKGLDFMTPNRQEAFQLAGVRFQPGTGDPKNDMPLRETGRLLLEKWQCSKLLITLGAEGMALFSEEEAVPLVIPTQARQVYDVSGAGDTVMATMTLALCAGAPYPQAAALANEAAGIVVGYAGTCPVDADELCEVLREKA